MAKQSALEQATQAARGASAPTARMGPAIADGMSGQEQTMGNHIQNLTNAAQIAQQIHQGGTMQTDPIHEALGNIGNFLGQIGHPLAQYFPTTGQFQQVAGPIAAGAGAGAAVNVAQQYGPMIQQGAAAMMGYPQQAQ